MGRERLPNGEAEAQRERSGPQRYDRPPPCRDEQRCACRSQGERAGGEEVAERDPEPERSPEPGK